MTATWTCTELRAAAPDLAVDELTGAERAAALAHLAACPDCRGLVAELALVADSLLLLAPPTEPPAGFESRVVERASAAPRPRSRRPRTILAAAIAAAAGLAVGVLAASLVDDEPRRLPVAAVLVDATGAASGTVVVADGPDRMTCVFEHRRFGGAYRVEVELADGSVTDLGSFEAPGSPWSWTVPLPVDAADVHAVRVLSTDGVVRVSAELTG